MSGHPAQQEPESYPLTAATPAASMPRAPANAATFPADGASKAARPWISPGNAVPAAGRANQAAPFLLYDTLGNINL
jgi:hypothetical protein